MNHPIRFCMITTFFPPWNFGGDGTFVYRLSNELGQRGHRVDVIHCVDSFRLLSGRASELPYPLNPNVTVHSLKSRFGFLAPFATHQIGYPMLNAKKIKAILSKGFDVIHFHNISLIGGPAILGFGDGIKLATVHDYWMVCPNHTLFKFNKKICSETNCFFCDIIYKRPIQLWRHVNFLKRKVKHIDLLIAPSRFIKKVHQSKGIDIPMIYLPNFGPPSIESEITDTKSPDPDKTDKSYFLFAGRLEKNKGLQTIIPVFKNYRQASLLIAGTGTYENRLRKLSADDDNIRFLGFQPQSELNRLYAESVALIVPSLWYENFPLVILEAFGCRTPVIARNIGALTEIITHAGGGLLFNTDKDLVTCMNQLLTNPPYRRKLGANARRAHKNEWAVKSHLDKYLAVIDKMLRTG